MLYLALLIAVALAPRSASAEATAQERALSESLFQEGKKLLDEGRAAEACPKLAESQRLDPGGGTQLLLGLCWERAGRIASAWVELNEALALATRDGRESRINIAREHIAALEPRLSRISFELAEAADVPGLTISRNGMVIPRAAWSIATPFDEGEHEFEVSAPGYETKTVVVVVEGEGQLVPFEIPVLKAAPEEQGSATPTPSSEDSTLDQPPTARSPSPQTIVGWSLVGGSLVAGGIGGYFGLRAISLSGETNKECPTDVCDRPDLKEDYEKAGTSAQNANVAFIAAGVLLTAGVVTLLTRPSRGKSAAASRTRVAIAPREGGAAFHLGGSF